MRGCDYARSPESETFMKADVSGIAYDSRKVEDGYLFVAIKGEKFDGHDFIDDAILKGAVAVVTEKELPGVECGVLLVKDGRKALACISNNFYGRPWEDLTLMGVTGTNGKTTTTYILKSILESWGKNVGLIGTIRYMIKDKVYPAPHTTPESLEFQGLLRKMLSSGCTHVVTEVSSHALSQHRVDGAAFHTAIFTNLTRDHLDFHNTMEDYFSAKQRLFLELLNESGTAVLNIDDPFGKRLDSALRKLRPGIDILTYGIAPGADITADEMESSFEGLRFRMVQRGVSYPVTSKLTGMPNVYNIMSAVGASISLNVPWQTILDGIENVGAVAGRFERVDAGQGFLCIVDYAHSEDALERLIRTARQLLKESTESQTLLRRKESPPKIITVFGCGGDRDRGKRPGMGGIATRLSDFVVITSDNPRSEEPSDIIKDIIGGVSANNYYVEPDRRRAIAKAVEMAQDGDIVLIAGKGHEDYQEIKGVRYPFSDRAVARETIEMKMRKSEQKKDG